MQVRFFIVRFLQRRGEEGANLVSVFNLNPNTRRRRRAMTKTFRLKLDIMHIVRYKKSPKPPLLDEMRSRAYRRGDVSASAADGFGAFPPPTVLPEASAFPRERRPTKKTHGSFTI